ncbi:hypothetical protein [Arthrobacter burdickii]|uniref:Uncharacterized protein n=1 Tax=Arthrobacter burdickii TaxID=3035920 RepID=A0ABT8JYQ2_9MICC|nr:hypothetical protein [Arthrobacter burdickii]MDN4609913.1 hypothetical protein [Arthrobacter burdickii]
MGTGTGWGARGRAIWAGVVVAVVLIAAIVTIKLVDQSVFGPDKPVEAYLDALVAGDAEASRSLLGRTPGDGQDALLSNAVYGTADQRITGYELRDISVNDDTATVTAQLMQDGSTSTLEFTLTRTGYTGVFFGEWRLDGPEPVTAISMVIPEDLQTLTVNGAGVALPPGEATPYPGLRSVVLPALPGEYVVSPPAPSRYLSYGAQQAVTVTADGVASRGVLVKPVVTPSVMTDAVAEVTAVLDRCIASTEAAPSGCPNRSYLFGDPEDVRDPRWALVGEPTFTLEQSYQPGVYRLWSDDAETTFSYERNAEFDGGKLPRWTRQEDTRRLSLGAIVTVTAEQIEVDLDQAVPGR